MSWMMVGRLTRSMIVLPYAAGSFVLIQSLSGSIWPRFWIAACAVLLCGNGAHHLIKLGSKGRVIALGIGAWLTLMLISNGLVIPALAVWFLVVLSRVGPHVQNEPALQRWMRWALCLNVAGAAHAMWLINMASMFDSSAAASLFVWLLVLFATLWLFVRDRAASLIGLPFLAAGLGLVSWHVWVDVMAAFESRGGICWRCPEEVATLSRFFAPALILWPAAILCSLGVLAAGLHAARRLVAKKRSRRLRDLPLRMLVPALLLATLATASFIASAASSDLLGLVLGACLGLISTLAALHLFIPRPSGRSIAIGFITWLALVLLSNRQLHLAAIIWLVLALPLLGSKMDQFFDGKTEPVLARSLRWAITWNVAAACQTVLTTAFFERAFSDPRPLLMLAPLLITLYASHSLAAKNQGASLIAFGLSSVLLSAFTATCVIALFDRRTLSNRDILDLIDWVSPSLILWPIAAFFSMRLFVIGLRLMQPESLRAEEESGHVRGTFT